MDEYDPRHAPDPDEWLAMDETERYLLVQDHHREAGVELPDELLHAMFHAVVETQLAMDDPPEVRETLERVRREGLDRHDAIHAVGSVLTETMWETAEGNTRFDDPNEDYVRELNRLTVESWRGKGE